jgi:vancomycin resistance protein YoaR
MSEDNQNEDSKLQDEDLDNDYKNKERYEVLENASENEDENSIDKNSNEEVTENTQISKYKPKNMVLFIIMIGFLVLIFSATLLFAVIACVNKLNNNVYKNVYLFGHDISGKSIDEVTEIIKQEDKSQLFNKQLEIYQDSELIYTVKAEDIDFTTDIDSISNKVMEFGRSGNILSDNFNILKAFFNKKDISVEYTYNSEKMDNLMKNIDLSLENRFVDDSYSIDTTNNKLVIVNGKSGISIDYDSEKINIITALENGEDLYKINTVIKKPSKINIDELYSKVKKDSKDAYIDKSVIPEKFVSEEVGYDLNVEELKSILSKEENNEEGKTIEFALTVIEPKVKLADITYNLYNDKLAGFTTYFSTSQTARANNLKIALSYLNDKIIMPGETFSYNATIGETTVAKGYLEAATFKAGKVVMELGGGICQTTSTLYNVALLANLEIVERHQHGLPVGYVQPSRDATVYSPVLDFKFKNTRNYPIKIVTSFSNSGNMNISIYGTKEANEYDVSITSKYLSTVPFTTKYVYDSTLASGTEIVDVNGVNGYTSEAYITKKLNGQVVSSTLLSRDTYNAQQRVLRVGVQQNGES